MRLPLILLLLGVVLEETVGIPFGIRTAGILLFALLLLAALLRRWQQGAGVLLYGIFIMLGIFATKTDAPQQSHRCRHTTVESLASNGMVHQVQQYMDTQRARLSAVYREQGLEGDIYGITAAMTLGEKQRVSKSLREVYSITGGAHVFALSGMHLSILFMLLSLLLPTERQPRTSAAILLVALWSYVLLVGMHASVLRAATMLTVYTLARSMLLDVKSVDVLALTAFVIITVVPHWLFDVGFQMSFMAVLSILLFYGPLNRWGLPFIYGPQPYNPLERHPFRDFRKFAVATLWGLFALSLTAQMGVAPLVMHYFHRYSCYFWLTNFIVSPAAVIVITLAIILFLLTAIHTMLPSIVTAALLKGTALALKGAVWCINSILTAIAQLPYASIEDIRLNVPQTILMYVVIIAISLLIARLWHIFGKKSWQ